MSPASLDPGDLLDLKLMPAWVKESSDREDYADYEGEEPGDRPERPGGSRPSGPRPRGRDRRPRETHDKRGQRRSRERGPGERNRPREGGRPAGGRPQQRPPKPEQPLEVGVQFVPRSAVLDNVVAQVKADALAYSLFFLARSFLDKPQRYEVALKTKPETPLYQLGESGPVSTDRGSLDSNAFGMASQQFYRTEVTQMEPLKGNFTSVARCRLSGVVLGPTNHHDYQRKMRSHYEQRFSRRMNFGEYQRQIENLTDPAAVEQWKEEARILTTFVSLGEPPATFQNASEAERHFRQHHLPGLTRSVTEVVIDGVTSRQLGEPRLRRHIEQAWSAENRSPSNMMHQLAKRFREAGLHIFRHRRGMLFVSSIRVRPFAHDEQSVSPHVKAILELVAASPRIRRKEVADKLLGDPSGDQEAKKLALASDLRWLISEGYIIEFNDGALDLPRVKALGTKPQTPENPQKEQNAQSPVADSQAAAETETSPTNPGAAISELGFA